MEMLEYDDKKLNDDRKAIEKITKEIENETKFTLQQLIDTQDDLMDNLALEYDRMINICKELSHITECIENARIKYNTCENKISDLLDKIRLEN